jgi:glycosyltransferase involved in cell wall biosynthesis
MPFFNAAATIGPAVESIRGQSFEEWELVAIDDGSSDGSPSLLPQDSRIRLLQPGRVGLVRALNLGIDQSRARLIARMDADDLMEPDRLAEQVNFLSRRHDIALVSSRVRVFPDEEYRSGYREYLQWQDECVEPEEIDANIYVEAPFVHPTVMFRRLEALRFREGDFPEDYELWLRMHELGLRMAKIPRVLLQWRLGPWRATATDPRYSRDAFDRIRAFYLSRDIRLRSARPVVVWGSGRRTRQRLRPLFARGVRPVAWIDIDPHKIGKQIDGAPVCPPGWLDREPKPLVLACVTSHGARRLIASELQRLGYRPGADFLPVGI